MGLSRVVHAFVTSHVSVVRGTSAPSHAGPPPARGEKTADSVLLPRKWFALVAPLQGSWGPSGSLDLTWLSLAPPPRSRAEDTARRWAILALGAYLPEVLSLVTLRCSLSRGHGWGQVGC